MVAIATDPAADLTLRGRMASELAGYVHPKRRAIDVTAETGSPGLTVVIRRFGEDEPQGAPAGDGICAPVDTAA
jgi:hypothetical protein